MGSGREFLLRPTQDMRPTPFVALAAASISLALAGCTGPNNSGNTDVACRALTVTSAHRPAGWGGTVFTIVMENHSEGQILGSSDAPYINSLVSQGAVAAGYHDSYVHPSEPNYLWMIAGENFGILDDNDPGPSNNIDSRAHLADQIEHAGLTWKAYEEGMGEPCGLVSRGTYAAKHDPFVYFDDINGWNGSQMQPSSRCADHVVDFTELDNDIASGHVPDYAFITPDLLDDMHDGTVADGDRWLSIQVPRILASQAFTKGGVLFIVWDEGSQQSDDPPFIVLSPNVSPGTVSQTPHDTSSFLLTVQKILGLDALPCSTQPASVQPMSELFTVPMR